MWPKIRRLIASAANGQIHSEFDLKSVMNQLIQSIGNTSSLSKKNKIDFKPLALLAWFG